MGYSFTVPRLDLLLDLLLGRRIFEPLDAWGLGNVQARKPDGTRRSFQDVMERVRDGSEEAARELVEEYGPLIRKVIRRRLDPRMRSKFDSIDFEQMVWASVFCSSDRLRELETARDLFRFIMALAKNKVVDEHRRRLNSEKFRVTHERHLDLAAADKRTSANPTPSQVVQAKELASRFLRGNSICHRRVMQMRMDGVSYQEIADELELDVGTVRRTVARIAQARLRST